MSLNLQACPDLVLEKIFSFLSVRDLKNIRLVSNRMSQAVLDLETRFKTWKIDILKSSFEESDKVSQHNLKIEVKIGQLKVDDKMKLVSWLTKYSSHITGITMCYKNLPQTVTFTGLKQVKKLELLNTHVNAVKKLLFSFGPQLEILNMNNARTRGMNHRDLLCINLSSLKYLQLIECEKETISAIFKVVPSTIESLEMAVSDIEFHSGMNHLSNLETLKITKFEAYAGTFKLPRNVLCRSLTRLHLVAVDLRDLEPVDTDLPSLKVMELKHCEFKKDLFVSLLKKSSVSLDKLILEGDSSINYDYQCLSLPALTTLELYHMNYINWVPHLLSACSKSLTNLKLCNLHFLSNSLDDLECDLPALKLISIRSCNLMDINNLLTKCSSSLQVLHVNRVAVKFEVNAPSLKELHLFESKVEGFTKLVSPQDSDIETIGLFCDAASSIWHDVARCRFPSLKVVYMSQTSKVEKLKTSSTITPYVKVITDSEEWKHHLKYDHVIDLNYYCDCDDLWMLEYE